MSLFNDILEQISKKLHSSEFYKEDISKIINQTVNLNIISDQIKVKDSVIYLNISSTLKTVIILKKTKLLESLKKYNIKDIR